MTVTHINESPKPRILVISSTYPRWKGDTEPGFVHSLCQHLSEKYSILVISPHAPGAQEKEQLDGIEVRRFRYAPVHFETLIANGGIVSNLKRSPWKWILVPIFFVGLNLEISRATREFRPHVIHSHWIIPQGITLCVTSLITKLPPVLVTSHGGDLFSFQGKLGSWLKRKALQKATAMTIVSEAMRKEAGRLGVDQARIHVAPMGVGFPSSSRALPKPRRIPGRILFVGRLVEKKGLTHLISALRHVIRLNPDAHLVVAGDGPERGRLEQQSVDLGIADRIRFLGPVSHEHLPELYSSASLFCAPFIRASTGDMEGLGLVTLEAIYFECPFIVGDVPAVADIVSPDLYSQCVVDPTNHEQFAEAILSTLRRSLPKGQFSFLKNRIEDTFSWEKVAERYDSILSELINKNGRMGETL